METKRAYLSLGIVSILIGIWLCLSSFQNLTGYIIAEKSISFAQGYAGFIFLTMGAILIVISRVN